MSITEFVSLFLYMVPESTCILGLSLCLSYGWVIIAILVVWFVVQLLFSLCLVSLLSSRDISILFTYAHITRDVSVTRWSDSALSVYWQLSIFSFYAILYFFLSSLISPPPVTLPYFTPYSLYLPCLIYITLTNSLSYFPHYNFF
jgi:hypothetical protein